jgi:putative transposase
MIQVVNLGYKYRLYPDNTQKQLLNHQMFVSNQAYNICVNLWQKEQEKNKKLPKEERKYRTATSYDAVVKRVLRARKISFSTVVTQQARRNFLKAVTKAFSKETTTDREKAIKNAQTQKEMAKALKLGFPKFHSSKDAHQSFSWNNQGYTIFERTQKFQTLRIMSNNIKFKTHRNLPDNYKMSSITISRDNNQYFVSFNIAFEKEIGLAVSSENLDISKSIGIDLNVENFAISSPMNLLMNNIAEVKENHLILNGSKNRRGLRYAKAIKVLERKQSRRVLKTQQKKIKLGKNYRKTQNKLNKLTKRLSNQKEDLYHKISTTLTNEFELIVVEDLKLKNQMTKSAKGNEVVQGKKVKQKAGLNRSLLSASFYQFVSMIQYKQTMLHDKLFVKVNPQYTSQECSQCGNRDKANRPKQDRFECTKCGYKTNPDIQASRTILKRGLEKVA